MPEVAGWGVHGVATTGCRAKVKLSRPLCSTTAFSGSPNWVRWRQNLPHQTLSNSDIKVSKYSFSLRDSRASELQAWSQEHCIRQDKGSCGDVGKTLHSLFSKSSPKSREIWLVGTLPWPHVECEHTLMEVCKPVLHAFISVLYQKKKNVSVACCNFPTNYSSETSITVYCWPLWAVKCVPWKIYDLTVHRVLVSCVSVLLLHTEHLYLPRNRLILEQNNCLFLSRSICTTPTPRFTVQHQSNLPATWLLPVSQ